MQTFYKETDLNGVDSNGIVWKKSVAVTDTVGHPSPLLATMFYPLTDPRKGERIIFACTGEDPEAILGTLKFKKLISISDPEPKPQVSLVQRVAFGILATRELGSKQYRTWADKWLSGEDRSPQPMRELYQFLNVDPKPLVLLNAILAAEFLARMSGERAESVATYNSAWAAAYGVAVDDPRTQELAEKAMLVS